MGKWIVLLRPKIIALGHRWRQPEQGLRAKPLALLCLAAGFWIFLFWVFQKMLVYFRHIDVFGDLLAANLLSMILLTFFTILLFSNFISSLSTFFLAEDLSLILSRPVKLSRLYLARFIETLIHSSWMVLLFGMPVFLAYGWVYQAPYYYYFFLPWALAPFLLIPASLGIIFSIILVNIYPARRTREILFFLSIFVVVALYFFLRFLKPERLVNPDSFGLLAEYFRALKTPSWPFSPSFWLSEILLPFLQKERAFNLFLLGLLWSTAAAMGIVGNWVAQALYLRGWKKSQESRKIHRVRKTWIERYLLRILRRGSPQIQALFLKDLKSFFRDTTQWSQLILLSALVVVYLYNFRVLPLEKSPLPTFFLKNVLAFLNMGLAGFVVSAVAGRFVFPAVSLEGSSFWIIRSSPLALKTFLRSKFWTSFVPLLFLAEALILLSDWVLQVSPFMMFLSSITIFFLTWGITCLGIGMGAIYPRFQFTHPAHIFSGWGGALYMILAMIFIGAVVLMEAWPFYRFSSASFGHHPLTVFEWAGIFLSLGGLTLLNSWVIVAPMRLGLKKIAERDFS